MQSNHSNKEVEQPPKTERYAFHLTAEQFHDMIRDVIKNEFTTILDLLYKKLSQDSTGLTSDILSVKDLVKITGYTGKSDESDPSIPEQSDPLYDTKII